MEDEWENEVGFGKSFNPLNLNDMDECDKNDDLNSGWDNTDDVTQTANNDSGWQATNDSGSGWNSGKNEGFDRNRRGGNGGGRGRGLGRNFGGGGNRRRNDDNQGQGYGNNDWDNGGGDDDKDRDRYNGGNRGNRGRNGGGGFGDRDNRRRNDNQGQGYGNNDWNNGGGDDDYKDKDRYNGGNRGRNGGGFGDRDNRRRNDNQERYSNKNGGNNDWNNGEDANDDNDSGRDRRYGGGNRGRGGGSGFDRRDNRSTNDDNQGRYGNNSNRNWNKNDGNDENDGNYGNGEDGNGGGRRGGGGGGNRGRGGGGAGEYGRGGRRGGGGGGGGRRDGDGGYGRNKDDDNNNEDKPKKEFYIPPEPTNDEDEIFSSGISCGINFDKYDKIPVNVSGAKDIPKAISSFDESGLRDFVLRNVEKSGYMRPTPVQKNAIPIIMEGKDLMGCAQTGSGKTAAFLLPIIDNLLKDNKTMSVGKPFALIVAPTRELAIQIFNEARKFSLGSYLKISLVYGGPAVKYQSDNVTKGCHILVATVGRLMHFVNSGIISFEDIRFVVLDEADRMLDKEEDIEKIMEHPTMPSSTERQTLMFSATFPDEIQRLAAKYLNNYLFLAVGKIGGACSDVEQNFCEVTKFQKRTKLMELLEEDHSRTIVFVETKRTADFLASLLSETKFPTTSIHGDRFQREREMALNDFKSGKMSVLIATSVAARGLDIKNVKHVINYDLPQTIDIYVHRIGRTGRVGNYGKATSFFDPETDHQLASGLVNILEEIGQEVPDFLRNVKSGGGRGGDGGGRYRDKFGGRDVRKDDENFTIGTEPASLEPEEEW